MEVDGDFEMVRIAIAASPLLDGSDLRVQTLSDGVGDDVAPAVLSRLFGGQGTMNVPNWSPDSKRFAYVTYPL